MNKKFVVIVLDSFGVGEMDDTSEVRPEDVGSNTALHLLEKLQEPSKLKNLEKLGLMNILGKNLNGLKMQNKAIFGKSKLKHYGADSFFGHQEISGTDPKKPIFQKFNSNIDDLEEDLISEGYEVERICRNNKCVLKIDNQMCIGDNIETDPGQAINVTGALDYSGWDKIKSVGMITRRHYQVPRIIAFGGSEVTIENITNSIKLKGEYIGVDAPESGVYNHNYHVVHIGYGVDTSVQLPTILSENNIKTNMYGKVADIVVNPKGESKTGVDTNYIFDMLLDDFKHNKSDFYFVNIQETDLAGHAEDYKRYLEILEISDKKIGELMELLSENDIMIVMADHGNDPFIGHSRHTRENVPILVHRKDNDKLIEIPIRDTLADVGATVADFYGLKLKHGKSFLKEIN